MNTQTRKLMFSSECQEWATPKELVDQLNKEFNFTLDLCASKGNAVCKRFYSIQDNCLIQSPKGEKIFCNPPYGRQIKLFVKKCFELSKYNLVVLLIPARTDTSYFHDYIYNKAEIRFIRGRLKFVKPNSTIPKNKFTPAPFPSMLAIYK